MILPKEIQQKARRAKVRDTQIEKDYILTWVLYGISQQPHLNELIAFKGGTVLKKVYFKEYRFSEDLDFTLLQEQYTDEYILERFEQAFNWILQEANTPLEITKNYVHTSGSINFHINYKGPLGGGASYKRLKIDITRGEQLVFKPIKKRVLIEYQDLNEFYLLCYPLEEVLIEKMCALIGRTEPRDLYDWWYLLEIAQLEVTHYWPEFTQKAKHKGHNPNQFTDRLEKKLISFKARWEGSLLAQIHELPPFDQVTRDIGKHLRKIRKTNK